VTSIFSTERLLSSDRFVLLFAVSPHLLHLETGFMFLYFIVKHRKSLSFRVMVVLLFLRRKKICINHKNPAPAAAPHNPPHRGSRAREEALTKTASCGKIVAVRLCAANKYIEKKEASPCGQSTPTAWFFWMIWGGSAFFTG
jgi:hypothetical protein